MTKPTRELIKIVEKRAGEQNAWLEAAQFIRQGANIKASTNQGSMIQAAIAQEKRQRLILPWKADNCLRLIEVLRRSSSDLLAAQILSDNGGDVNEMHQLVQLQASSYQTEKYGPLGLLGELLKQDKVSVRLDVVQLIVKGDPYAKHGLTAIDAQQQTCLSLAKNNRKCSKDVVEYLQREFDMILNQVPFESANINLDEVSEWITRGANTEIVDDKRNTVLSNAVLANNVELVRVLGFAGCNTAHTNADNLTPSTNKNAELQSLIKTKKSQLTIEEVNSALKNGANINEPIANKNTFLHLLITCEGTAEMVTTFVKDFHADLTTTNRDGYRPIEMCIVQDKEPFTVLSAFFQLSKAEHGVFFNSKLNKTLLQFALERKNSGAVKIIQDELNLRLWDSMARANTKEEQNALVITEANQLIGYGAQVNHKHIDKDFQEWTVLHFASDYEMKNGNDDYPISIAAEYGQLSIVQYLHRSLDSNLNVCNKNKQTPLHLATKNHQLLVVRYLVRWGVDHQAQDASKQTALNIARTNVSKNKEEESNDQKLVHFLEQLICPPLDKKDTQQSRISKPNLNLDTCEIVTSVTINPIQMIHDAEEEALGNKSVGFLAGNPNGNLYNAAKQGNIYEVNRAISQGADIRYRKGQYSLYEIAKKAMFDFQNKLKSTVPNSEDYIRYYNQSISCQQIIDIFRQIARTKIIESINQSNAGRVVSYHVVGAQLTADLLNIACYASDNVEIVDYLMNNSNDIYQAMFNYPLSDSPYRIAKTKKFNKVASYLKYRLSMECVQAIRKNNTVLVKKLLIAGASPDMHDTDSISEALKHQNLELIQILCESGAKMPDEWLKTETITLSLANSQQMKPDIAYRINHCLIDRRLRFAAANGDLAGVMKCQHLGADINSKNCYGSTALLYAIKYGNYFSIVHSLVSRGGSMLHENEDEPMSLIDLAKQQQFEQIADYLSKELNIQFLTTILNNDRDGADKFAKLGANVNYQDEQGRMALHYAVQYHGIELVKWLCEYNCSPNLADIYGDYPIIQATMKGDYAVVELFVTQYPATKQQTKTGRSVPAPNDSSSESKEPVHSYEVLVEASRNGRIKILQEFCQQRYKSIEQKKQICEQLIDIAKKANQYEIINILEPYYNKTLKTTLPSDIEIGEVVTLREDYKKILLACLCGLSDVITNSSVVLDPTDPNTYREFFSDLSVNTKKHSRDLQTIGNEQDVKTLITKDSESTSEHLAKINSQLKQSMDHQKSLTASIQDKNEKLSKEHDLSPLKLKQLFEEREMQKKQLATYECSILLYQRQLESKLSRQNTINFIKNNSNMYLFYRTIENRLEALFHSVLAAQGGYLQTTQTSKYGTAASVVNMVPTSIFPFSDVIVGAVKWTFSSVLSKLDEKAQKKEWHNISTLGNIEELGRIASDTAGLLTLYYKEQIQSIDVKGKIKGSNVFNDKIKWIKDVFYDVRPEGSEEMAVVIVAEYVTAWLLDALKSGIQVINPTEPLPQQLWLYVAKTDPIDQGRVTKVTNVLVVSSGQQKIPLRIKNDPDKEIIVQVQLRYLIGCVTVVGADGIIYQYPISKDSPKDIELNDLENFGYVYFVPFSSDDNDLKAIINGRKLTEVDRNQNKDITTRFDDILEPAKTYQRQSNEQARQSFITTETAKEVAKEKLEKARYDIESSVDNLREDIKQKTDFYQTSIDAAFEQIKNESAVNRETMKKDNQERYEQVWRKLSEQLKETEGRLEKRIEQRLNDIEMFLQEECKQMRAIVVVAQTDASKAQLQADEAAKTSKLSAQQATEAKDYTQKLVASTEERKCELQAVADKCEALVKQTVTQQKELLERSILEIRTKVQQDFERTKQAAQESAISAKESARAAKDTASAAQETVKVMKDQLETQKDETRKIIANNKDLVKQMDRMSDEARQTEKETKRSADASVTALEKVNNMYPKMEKALDQLERLAKKIETK
ncbi:unnamed protein product [Rotaria socialis]|uniref:Ankyrin repeat protein n=1 Tax=Rotaria socialis TaxID=392032 RepID=A0A817VHS2_9BILA|nr:unnamed protein product [Rotaria socialis]